MKTAFRIATIALALLQPAAQNSPITIHGSITNRTTAEPLSGVQIRLTAIPNNPRNAASVISAPLETVSDSEGKFEIPDVPAGRYLLAATRAGFVEPAENEKPSNPSPAVPLNLVSGQFLPEVQLEMIRGGAISGVITDAEGKAASGVDVSPYQIHYREGHPTFLASGVFHTNDRGEYRIGELAPGDYFIDAALASPAEGTSTRMFYPATRDPAMAKAVTVTAAGEQKSIDIGLQSEKTFSIRGRALISLPQMTSRTFSNGDADTSLQYFALSPRGTDFYEGPPPTIPNLVTTEAARRNGEFEIHGVRPGHYDLFPVVNVILNGEQRYGSGRIPVEVRAGDVEGLVLAINAGQDLRGTINFKGRSLLPDTVLGIVLHPLDNIPPSLPARIGTQPVGKSGAFSFRNVPEAVYSLIVDPMPLGAFISDVRIGKSSVFDSGIVVGKTPLAPIELILDLTGRRIYGVVQDANNKPVPNAVVVLVPLVQRRRNAALYHAVKADMDGKFQIHGVAPGEYKIFAWETVLLTAWQNAEFLSKYESQGSAVSVKVKSIFGLRIRAIPISGPK
jgi:hypothetical protein